MNKIKLGNLKEVDKVKIIENTKAQFFDFLETFWKEDENEFQELLCADIETVKKKYNLKNRGIGFCIDYFYEPPLNYISNWQEVVDEKNEYIAEFTAYYNHNLECIDERLK